MNPPLDNFRVGALARILKIWAPGLFTILALVGAFGMPLRSLYSTRAEHEFAKVRHQKASNLHRDYVAFQDRGGDERLVVLGVLTKELLPSELSPLQINAALRWIAPSCGVELTSLDVAPFELTDIPITDQAVAMAKVSLMGVATPSALEGLLSAMRGLGYPTSLLDVRFERATPEDSDFEVTGSLGIYQFTDPPREIEVAADDPSLDEI